MIQLSPVLAGVVTALSWGSADFIARYTSRALGLAPALFLMLLTSALIVSAFAWGAGQLPDWATIASRTSPGGIGLLLLYGLGVTAATLALYHALSRGPVTIAAPIVGSFPAFNLLIAFVLGTRPSASQWLAIVAVMGGVAIVARSAGHFEIEHTHSARHLRRTIWVSIAAAIIFGVSLSAGQEAGAIFGDLETVWAGRWIGVVICVGLVIRRRHALAIPLRWWPVVTVQGALDACAYLMLLLGSEGARSPIAAVIGSTFSVVTVLLARVIIRERMSSGQWLGIALVVAGVAVLSLPDAEWLEELLGR